MPNNPTITDGPVPNRHARRVIALSHTIALGRVTYPGLPTPTITSYLSREESPTRFSPGSEFTLDTITMIGNTGTYIDSAFHCFSGGTDLAGLGLESLVSLPAEVVRLPRASGRGMQAGAFSGRGLEAESHFANVFLGQRVGQHEAIPYISSFAHSPLAELTYAY